MIFTELRFFLFLALVLGVYWALRPFRWRKRWLLAASYVFYGAWDWRFLSLILVSTVADYFAGLGIDRASSVRGRRAWLGVSLGVNLGLLVVFKYLGFLVESAAALLEWFGFHASLPTLQILLPVGISFYTFQTLSYSLDIYFGRLKPTRSFLDLALFVAFFPQLVAGPVVRASEFLPQLESARPFPADRLRALSVLFLVGFVKKACVADNVGPIVDAYWAAPGEFDLLSSWMGALFFFVQLYGDFSGYTDMAIACAGLLGFQLGLNFDFPLLSRNVQLFWRRWHMSLFTWFRDYVYLPLGGSRGSRLRVACNALMTTLLSGLWHGAAWTFVLWGGSVGLSVILFRIIKPRLPARLFAGALGALLATALTYVSVTLGVILFRSPDLGVAATVYRALLMPGGAGDHSLGLGPPLLFLGLALVHWGARQRVLEGLWLRSPSWAFAACYGAALPPVLVFTREAALPFVYFQF